MKEFFKRIFAKPKVRKTVGIVLVVIGFLALITPLTPGAWLIPIGLWLLGFKFLFWKKTKTWFQRFKRK